jgi:hypothetical protein
MRARPQRDRPAEHRDRRQVDELEAHAVRSHARVLQTQPCAIWRRGARCCNAL